VSEAREKSATLKVKLWVKKVSSLIRLKKELRSVMTTKELRD
jgi:hypothetical protein